MISRFYNTFYRINYFIITFINELFSWDRFMNYHLQLCFEIDIDLVFGLKL